MNTTTVALEHRADRRITPRADRIDAKHVTGDKAPTLTLKWDRAACEAGAWRAVVDGRTLRVAPARGLDADTVLREVIEDLLAADKRQSDLPDPRNPKSEIPVPKSLQSEGGAP